MDRWIVGEINEDRYMYETICPYCVKATCKYRFRLQTSDWLLQSAFGCLFVISH